MTGTPQLTVIMSVYNNDAYVSDAISSVLGQSFKDFRFLIVNDGSSDGSAAIIDSHAATDSRIHVIHQENRGLVASLNRLVNEATSPLLARMDGDDICLPDRFAKQVHFLEQNPDHGVLGTWATSVNATGAIIPEGGEKPVTDSEVRALLKTGPLFNHSSVIMRRDLVRDAGGYRPAYRHCEDYDLWLRLAPVTKMANLQERLLLYRQYEGQVSSRHHVEQLLNTGIAYAAYLERQAGGADPTATLDRLPTLSEIDACFSQPGLSAQICANLVGKLLYDPVSLRGDGLAVLIQHVRNGGDKTGLWRTVARLFRMGEAKRGYALASTLLVR